MTPQMHFKFTCRLILYKAFSDNFNKHVRLKVSEVDPGFSER